MLPVSRKNHFEDMPELVCSSEDMPELESEEDFFDALDGWPQDLLHQDSYSKLYIQDLERLIQQISSKKFNREQVKEALEVRLPVIAKAYKYYPGVGGSELF